MPSKPSNRKSPARKQSEASRSRQSDQSKATAAPAAGRKAVVASRAGDLRQMSRSHGNVVVTALVSGFSLGLILGGLLVHSKMRGNWPDRSSLQATGRRILNQMESHLPEKIRDKMGLC